MEGPIFNNDKFYCTACKFAKLYHGTIWGCIGPSVIDFRGLPAKHGVTSSVSPQLPRDLETPVWCEFLEKRLRKEKLTRLRTL